MTFLKHSLTKPLAVAALGLALVAPTFDQADARSRGGRVAAGIAAGVVAGAIIAGAASSSRATTYYSAPDCSDLRRRAIWNEDHGRYSRARYYWDRYEECRGR
jgi:hypothetical protein